MSVTATLKKYVEKYGTTVSLSSDGKVFGTPYRAFIQPLRYKNKMYLMGVRSKLGWIDQSHYLYIGPAEKDVASLTSAARIRSQNENFYIVKAENVHLGDNIFYNWAVIRAVVEDQTAQAAQPPIHSRPLIHSPLPTYRPPSTHRPHNQLPLMNRQRRPSMYSPLNRKHRRQNRRPCNRQHG